MSELSIAKQNFLDKKLELQIARQNEAKKRSDIEALNSRKQDLNIELAALNERLAQSSQAMANGDMTSEEYIALKRSIADKGLESESVGEAIKFQSDALQLLINNSRDIGQRLSELLPAVAGEIKQRALAASVAANVDQLKLFAIAVAAENFRNHPFTGPDKNYQAQLGYQILGEELCKAVFADTSESTLFFVEPSRAKSAIEEIINQAA
jgi:hypothetical protein